MIRRLVDRQGIYVSNYLRETRGKEERRAKFGRGNWKSSPMSIELCCV